MGTITLDAVPADTPRSGSNGVNAISAQFGKFKSDLDSNIQAVNLGKIGSRAMGPVCFGLHQLSNTWTIPLQGIYVTIPNQSFTLTPPLVNMHLLVWYTVGLALMNLNSLDVVEAAVHLDNGIINGSTSRGEVAGSNANQTQLNLSSCRLIPLGTASVHTVDLRMRRTAGSQPIVPNYNQMIGFLLHQ